VNSQVFFEPRSRPGSAMAIEPGIFVNKSKRDKFRETTRALLDGPQ
jgi:hypothetical protein